MMLTKKERVFWSFFVVILAMDLICSSFEPLHTYRYFTKPALLSSLIVHFLRNSGHLAGFTKNFMLMALVFSLLGDALLMFADRSQDFFIGGLAAFLLAHVMYFLVFYRKRGASKTWPFLTILTIYGMLLLYFLKDGLASLVVPVLLYVIAIVSMAAAARTRQGIVPRSSYRLVLYGALLFMLSDSMIALDKFHGSFQYANIAIMLTYGLAQLFIVSGVLRQQEN